MPKNKLGQWLTREDKAELAAHALDVYGIQKFGAADYDQPEAMASDLICDLLHLIRGHEADPMLRLELARAKFKAEDA